MSKIKVAYQDQGNSSLTEEEITGLTHLEEVITRNAEEVFFSNSNYLWERDPSVASGSYGQLVKTFDRKVVLSEPLAFLVSCTDEQFLEAMKKAEREAMREQQRRQRLE